MRMCVFCMGFLVFRLRVGEGGEEVVVEVWLVASVEVGDELV